VCVSRKSSGRHGHLEMTEKLFHSAVEQRLQLSDKRLSVRMFIRQVSFIFHQVEQQSDVTVSNTPYHLKRLLQPHSSQPSLSIIVNIISVKPGNYASASNNMKMMMCVYFSVYNVSVQFKYKVQYLLSLTYVPSTGVVVSWHSVDWKPANIDQMVYTS